MKRPVSEIVRSLNSLPPDSEVTVLNVWSNGRKIRRLSGQDESSTWHPPSKGYRRMTAILIEGGGVIQNER